MILKFIEYLNYVDDIYENIEKYTLNKQQTMENIDYFWWYPWWYS